MLPKGWKPETFEVTSRSFSESEGLLTDHSCSNISASAMTLFSSRAKQKPKRIESYSETSSKNLIAKVFWWAHGRWKISEYLFETDSI
jgi:hypothetical protein